MWQWIQGNIGIIIIAISFGISGLGWLFQKLKQVQEKKRADQARQRARLEALRTGRIESGPQPGAAAATVRGQAARPEAPRRGLEDLARRRQEEQQQRVAAQRRELEEQLRRRREAIEAQRLRQQQRQGGAQRPAPAPPGAGRGQPQPQRGGRRVGPRPGQQPARRPAPAPVARPAEPPRRTGERRPVAPLPTARPIQQTVIADMIGAQGEPEEGVVAALPPLPGSGGRRSGAVLASGIDARQAIIMREIFDRPVSMRDPIDPGW